jgi:hypothetical protein
MSALKIERVERNFLNFEFFWKDAKNAKNNVNMSKIYIFWTCFVVFAIFWIFQKTKLEKEVKNQVMTTHVNYYFSTCYMLEDYCYYHCYWSY